MRLIRFLILMPCLVAPAAAQDKPLTVITRVLPPFVIEEVGSCTGFSIELWKAITTEIGRNSKFKAKANVKELLSAIEAGEGELGMSAISITSERLKNSISRSQFTSRDCRSWFPRRPMLGLACGKCSTYSRPARCRQYWAFLRRWS